jgi:hypothetical protein
MACTLQGGYVVCNVLKVEKETKRIHLSDFVDTCYMVQLETSEDAFLKAANTSISDHYIGIRNFGGLPYKLFNHDGELIRNIGHVGEGPNEYTKVYSDIIEEESNKIYLQPWPKNQIYVYNTSGDFLPPIKLHYGISKANLLLKDTIFTIINLPFSVKSIVGFQQNLDGQLLHEVSAANYWLKPDFSNEIMSSFNTDQNDLYLFRFFKPVNDALYHYDNQRNSLVPKFAAYFGSEDIPMHAYYELPNLYIIEIMESEKGVRNTTTVGKRLFILVDKNQKKATYFELINDFYGIPGDPIFRNGMFINNMPAIEVKERTSNSLKEDQLSNEQRIQLNVINYQITESDNNVVFWGRLTTKRFCDS